MLYYAWHPNLVAGLRQPAVLSSLTEFSNRARDETTVSRRGRQQFPCFAERPKFL